MVSEFHLPHRYVQVQLYSFLMPALARQTHRYVQLHLPAFLMPALDASDLTWYQRNRNLCGGRKRQRRFGEIKIASTYREWHPGPSVQ